MRIYKKYIVLWLPVALWCGLIFYFSSLPDLSSGLEYDFFLRKMAHALEYAVLAALVWRAVSGSIRLSFMSLASIVFFFCVLYAMSDELHQGFVSGRTAAVKDVVIDAMGALAAVVCISIRTAFRK